MIERTDDLFRVEAWVQRIQYRSKFEEGICCNRELCVIAQRYGDSVSLLYADVL